MEKRITDLKKKWLALDGKMRNKALIAIALVVIGGGYFWYRRSHLAAAPVQYRTASAEKGTLTTSVSASGNVIVDQSANVDPTINGTVANLAVNVGDAVKKGQFLFDIVNDQLGVNSSKAYSSYLQAVQDLDTAKADKRKAEQDYDNASGSDDKYIAKKKYEAAKKAVDIAERDISVSLASFHVSQSDASKRHVTAPIAGTVNAINIKNGDDLSKVSSGSSRQVPLIIGDLTTLKAQVQVNEVDVANVSLGQKVMLTFNAIDGLQVSGKVEKMDSLGTLTQGVVTYNVTVCFDTLDKRIKPEMSVSAAIITSVKQDVLLVPSSAVKTQGGQSYVQVISGGAPVSKTVEMGLANDTQTEIVSGISVGDQVVTQTINPGATTSASATSATRGSNNFHLPGLGGGGRPD